MWPCEVIHNGCLCHSTAGNFLRTINFAVFVDLPLPMCIMQVDP